MRAMLALMLTVLLSVAACSKANADVDPKAIEQKYGLSGGYVDEISTEDGKVKATIIPTTLDDGRRVQLVIPHQPIGNHQVYMREGITITPLELSDSKLSKQQFVQSQPRIVERRDEEPITTTTQMVLVGNAKAFLPELQKKYPNVEVIPISELDLNTAALRKKQPAG